ncbi:DUF4279 domain-containing protein [Verrucomicrobiota bacterium sgz303538]
MDFENGKWFRVGLKLMGDALDPTAVGGALGLRADVIGIKGERRRGKSGRVYAPYETNLWIHYHESPDNVPFEIQIEELFSALGPRVSVLKEHCMRENVFGELSLGFSSENGQGGDTLSRSTVRRIAEAGLSIWLDLYPPQTEEDESEPQCEEELP